MKISSLITTILLALTIWSCGSRKVDLHKRINDIETNLNIKIKELEVNRKQASEYLYSESFRADSIVEENGKRKIYNPSIDKEEKKFESLEEESKEIETEIDKKEIDKSKEKGKHTERKQVSWWYVLFPIGILLLILFFFWKRLKTKSRLF